MILVVAFVLKFIISLRFPKHVLISWKVLEFEMSLHGYLKLLEYDSFQDGNCHPHFCQDGARDLLKIDKTIGVGRGW